MTYVVQETSIPKYTDDWASAIRPPLTLRLDACRSALFECVCGAFRGYAPPPSARCHVCLLGYIRHRLEPCCLGWFLMRRGSRACVLVERAYLGTLQSPGPTILSRCLHRVGRIRRDACGPRLVYHSWDPGWGIETAVVRRSFEGEEDGHEAVGQAVPDRWSDEGAATAAGCRRA